MRKQVVLILAILFFSHCLAQEERDSLKKTWADINLEDTTRLKALNSLILDYYLGYKNDSAIILSKKMLDYAIDTNIPEYEVDAQITFGRIYRNKADYSKAIKSFNSALVGAEEIKDSTLLGNALHRLGEIYNQKGDYLESFKFFQKAIEIYKLTGNKSGEGFAVGSLGTIYNNLDEWGEAEKYYLEQIDLCKEIDDKRCITAATINLGGVYEGQGNMIKAVEYWGEGIKLAKEEKVNMYVVVGLSNIVSYYIDQKQFTIASAYLEEYKELSKQYDSKYYFARSQIYQCQIEYGLGNYAEALNICKSCYALTDYGDLEWVRRDALKRLYELNKKIGRSDEALDNYEKYLILKDSLKRDEAKTEIHRIVFNNQLEADSLALVEEKRLINATYEAEVRKKNQTKNLYLVIGLVVLLLAAGLYYRLRYVRKSRAVLKVEKQKAEKSEQVKQDFLANMSHEIRTPMNAVLGMTNLVLDLPLEEKQRFYVEGIKKSGDNLLHIINEILDISKIEAGKMELDEVDFSIREAVDQVKQILQHKADEKDLELVVIVASDVPDIVVGDPTRLTQILINLVGNAIKFTLKGSVTLNVKNVQEGIQFNVVDTGIGIPEDKLQTVFESFSQANTSDTRKFGGTGLGLSISQQLVEMMDGRIDVESKEGFGTTFSVIIDFKKGSMKRLKNRIAKDEGIDGSILDGLNILLVDDNEYNIIVARDTLKSKAKLEISEAGNGQEAIDLVKKIKFDVILMDVQMPVMNGFDATHYIRTQLDSPLKEIPIIALTASVVRTDLDKCIDAGMNSYIPKPFKVHQLITGIAEVLNIELKTKKLSKPSSKQISKSLGVTDLSYLEKFCDGDVQRMKKYVDMFISAAPVLIEKIASAKSTNDLEEIANQVHGFKTKWIMMGMTKTKDVAISLEQLCRENSDKNLILEKVSILMDDIEKALDELKDFVE